MYFYDIVFFPYDSYIWLRRIQLLFEGSRCKNNLPHTVNKHLEYQP